MKNTFYLLICFLILFSCSQQPKKYTKTVGEMVYQTQSDSIVISVFSRNVFRVEHYAFRIVIASEKTTKLKALDNELIEVKYSGKSFR